MLLFDFSIFYVLQWCYVMDVAFIHGDEVKGQGLNFLLSWQIGGGG